MALIQTVHLSIANFKSAPVVPAVQNDTDRQVKMIIDDYTLTSGLTGKIAFERSDGTHYETAAELVLADNAFTADIDQALTQPGRTMVQLKVTDTLTVSTFSFVIFVEQDNSGTVTPQEGIDLVSAVQAAEDAADRAEAAAETLELDDTLTESGKAADAAAVGNAIANIEIDVDATLTQEGEAADAKAVGDEIGDLKTQLKETGLSYDYDFLNVINGYFINAAGILTENESYSVSDIIHVKNGQIIVFTGRGYLTSVAMISSVANGVYTPLVMSIDSTDQTYTYQATKDIDIVLSYKTANIHTCIIYNNIPAIIEGIESKSNTLTIDLSDSITGKAIDIYGVYSDNGNYSVSKPFYIGKGDVLQITATGYRNSTAILSEDNGGVYVPLVPSATGVTEYSYTATRSMKVVMCYRTANTHECRQTFNYNPVEVEHDIYDLQNPGLEYLFLIHKMGGIGDSLMSGELYYSGQNHKDAYNYSWLSNLSKYAVNDCVHYSAGGMTTKAWLEDSGGYRTALENETTPCDVYFVALGTNDKNQSVYQIGDITDTAGTASFVGYYKQIIELVHAKNPNAYIFCLSMYDGLSASIPYSNIVEDIAELYSYCYFIDFASNTKHTPKTTDYYAQNSHYTSIGYLYAAQLIKKLVEEIINNNKNDFKWIGLN